MPSYTYVSEEDENIKVEKFFHMGKAPKKLTVGGKKFLRQVFPDFTVSQGVCSNWPQHSVANGTDPRHVKKAMEIDKSLGVPIDYDKKGRAIFTSSRQKNRWLRAHRRVDHDAGYGAPAPGCY